MTHVPASTPPVEHGRRAVGGVDVRACVTCAEPARYWCIANDVPLCAHCAGTRAFTHAETRLRPIEAVLGP